MKEKENKKFVPCLYRDFHISSLSDTDERVILKSDVVECLREVKDWIDNYRKSNELWRKSQDENLDDFEDELKSVFGDVKNEIRKRRR